MKRVVSMAAIVVAASVSVRGQDVGPISQRAFFNKGNSATLSQLQHHLAKTQ
jgi:hypothetical protein